MRRILVILAGTLVAVGLAAVSGAQTPGETPFPAPKISNVFVAAQTVTAPGHSLGEGALNNYFKQGEKVVFRAFAAHMKTGRVLTAEDVKYFYVRIPGQPPLKLAYGADERWPWTATWTIPADFALGLVNFKVLVQTTSRAYGSFVQLPVASAQLTVTKA